MSQEKVHYFDDAETPHEIEDLLEESDNDDEGLGFEQWRERKLFSGNHNVAHEAAHLAFSMREQAVRQVAKADPKNIQEVAASQLSIINSYYQSGLQQSQQSFRWSLIWGGIGFGFLIVAVSVLLLRQSTEIAFASSLAGALVEAFAGIYLYLYKHASDQLAAFRANLEETQRLLLANSMCEKLEGHIEQTTRAEIIRLMVNSVVTVQEPSSSISNI